MARSRRSDKQPSLRDGVLARHSRWMSLDPIQKTTLLSAAKVSESDKGASEFIETIELGINLSLGMRESGPSDVLRELKAFRKAVVAVVEAIHGHAPGEPPTLSLEAITWLENCGTGPMRAVPTVRVEGTVFHVGGDQQEQVRGFSFHEACVGATYLLIHVDDVLRTLSQPGRRPAYHRRILAQYTFLALRDKLGMKPATEDRGTFTTTLREVLLIARDYGKRSENMLPDPSTRDVRALVQFVLRSQHRQEGD